MGQDNAIHRFRRMLIDVQLPCLVLALNLFNTAADQFASCAFGLSGQNLNQGCFVHQLGVIRLPAHALIGPA